VWSGVSRPPCWNGPNLQYRGINPAYFALIAEVENAAGKRRSDDYVPDRVTKKWATRNRADLRRTTFAEWTIGTRVDDGWYWRIDYGGPIVWEGIVMPRRV
jgi:hypothetical protein